jgi:hypothetical protein
MCCCICRKRGPHDPSKGIHHSQIPFHHPVGSAPPPLPFPRRGVIKVEGGRAWGRASDGVRCQPGPDTLSGLLPLTTTHHLPLPQHHCRTPPSQALPRHGLHMRENMVAAEHGSTGDMWQQHPTWQLPTGTVVPGGGYWLQPLTSCNQAPTGNA